MLEFLRKSATSLFAWLILILLAVVFGFSFGLPSDSLTFGKTKFASVHGESIGLLCFRGAGVRRFREAVERAMRTPEGIRAWYLSVVHTLAQEGGVQTASIRGMWWQEIDSPEDLEEAHRSLAAGPRAAAGR